MTVTLATAALGAALATSAIPASAQVARAQPAFSAGDSAGLLTLVRDRNERADRSERANRNDRGDRSEAGDDRRGRADRNNSRSSSGWWRGNSRWSDARWHRRHRDSFSVGFAFAPSFAEPYPYVDDDAVAYCVSRFQSYDIASGTYLGYDGLRHPCP